MFVVYLPEKDKILRKYALQLALGNRNGFVSTAEQEL